jgi:2-methylcitrate dehydratase PrpD
MQHNAVPKTNLIHARTTMQIAEFVCDTTFSDLPPEVVDYAKILTLSYLGANVAGATMKCGRLVNNYVKGRNGNSEAGVFGAGFRTNAEYAALANGNSAHATELEDDSFPETMYSCGHWPATFAMGEKLRLPGKEVIGALVIGYEIAAKLGLAYLNGIAMGKAPWAALSSVGSAVIAAKMLRLNVEQTACAISLAVSQAAGMRRQNGTGAHIIEAGFSGRNGISAAELASLGCTANTTVLEGKNGFGDLWSNRPEFDLPLGDDYRLYQVGVKKYSCCFGIQRNIDTLLNLIAEQNLKWDDIAKIEHGINETVSPNFVNHQQPENEEDARFSFEHCTVACFFDEGVFLPSFTMERVRDPKWQEARQKVTIKIHSDFPLGTYDYWDSPLTVTMKNGEIYMRTCHRATGSPDMMRFGVTEATKKFMDCINFAGTFSSGRAEQIADLVLSLDRLPDISEVASLLTYPDEV